MRAGSFPGTQPRFGDGFIFGRAAVAAVIAVPALVAAVVLAKPEGRRQPGVIADHLGVVGCVQTPLRGLEIVADVSTARPRGTPRRERRKKIGNLEYFACADRLQE